MQQTEPQQPESEQRFEQLLVAHCAPVLAGLKSANLMNAAFGSRDQFLAMIESYHRRLSGKGVSIALLRCTGQRALVYVYRQRKLLAELKRPGVLAFLREQGYASLRLEDLLAQLRLRLQSQAGFPHEIGLFLGYPLHDVVGFIENGGRNCCCTGCWKVYDCVCDAQKLFARFARCTSVYQQMFQKGKPIMQLTVAA